MTGNQAHYDRAVGRVVTGFSVGSDRAEIVFGAASLTLVLDADCCSRSYFHDAQQFDALAGATIVSIEERALGEVPNESIECTRAHCIVVTTDRGQVTLDWRNDSNGYYDGSVVPLFAEARA